MVTPFLLQTYGFLNFVHEAEAVSFWEAGQQGRVTLQGQRLSLNWAKATTCILTLLVPAVLAVPHCTL